MFPFKAVLSPCSECQNYQTDPTAGYPACPRRYWREQKAQFDNGSAVVEPPPYLLESGTDSADQYANPVYFQNNQTILLWIAPLIDNRVAVDKDGSIATGNIFDHGSFDTRWINCQMLPVLPEESWAEMLTKGAYKEWNSVLVTPTRETQEELAQNTLFLAPAVQLGGFARKVNFAFECTQTSPQTNRLAGGT